MSAPIKELGKLSIGGTMPTTRAQAQRHGEGIEGSEPSPDFELPGGEETPPLSPGAVLSTGFVEGRSCISYDLRGLSNVSQARAISGLTGEYDVDKCRATPRGFDFQLTDHGRVQLSQGVQLGQGSMKCSCSDFESTDEACRHIFWLVDQLHRHVLPRRPSPGVQLQKGGESPQFSPMYKLVTGKMEDIARKADWPFVTGAASPSDTTDDSGVAMSRPDRARDIMSAFSETTMPDDFRPDLVEAISQHRTPEQCVVQGDFEATMFRLAVHDDDVYNSLRKAMPSGARAAIFFDKIKKRSENQLHEFDEYCRKGTIGRGGRALEVPVVAERLKQNVELIQKNIISRAPHGLEHAAEAILDLLGSVCGRNFDAFQRGEWNRPAVEGEGQHDRNLYIQLIGQAAEPESFFGLDALESLPPHMVRERQPLKDILGLIHTYGAPAPYIRRLESLTFREQPDTLSRSGATTTSGQKRHAPRTPGGHKKRPRDRRL